MKKIALAVLMTTAAFASVSAEVKETKADDKTAVIGECKNSDKESALKKTESDKTSQQENSKKVQGLDSRNDGGGEPKEGEGEESEEQSKKNDGS